MVKTAFTPDWVIHPWISLKEFLEAFHISQKDLSNRIWMSEKHIVDIIKWASPITPETALKLENVFPKDIAPASFWNNLQLNYDVNLARIKQQESLEKDKEILWKFSYSDLVKNNIIEWFNTWQDKIIWLRNFFWVSELWNIWNVFWVAFRKNDCDKISAENVYAWLRYWELESRKLQVQEFDKSKLKSKLGELRSLTKDKDFWEKIVKICAECWVKVVYSPYITKTYVNWATRWIGNNPVLQLTIRWKYADIFWFTFFHELGHILLHGKKEEFLEFDNWYKDSNVAEKETEADNFSTNTLISNWEFSKFFQKWDFTQSSIISFAKQVWIHEWIVAGRLSHVMNDYRTFEKLRPQLKISN